MTRAVKKSAVHVAWWLGEDPAFRGTPRVWCCLRRECVMVMRLEGVRMQKVIRTAQQDWYLYQSKCVVCEEWIGWPTENEA